MFVLFWPIALRLFSLHPHAHAPSHKTRFFPPPQTPLPSPPLRYKGYDEDYLQQQLMMARAAGDFATGGYDDGDGVEDEEGEVYSSGGFR